LDPFAPGVFTEQQTLAVGGEVGEVHWWDVATGGQHGEIEYRSIWGITVVAFSPDGTRLAIGDGDGNIKLIPIAEWRFVKDKLYALMEWAFQSYRRRRQLRPDRLRPYLLSYAPFLALTPNSNIFTEYRAPRFYRPAEWMILRTPLQPLLLEWADWHDVRHTTEIQVLFFHDGVTDPGNECHWAL
jgi:hypothetical protein